MKKGVIKASACCLVGVMALGGNSGISLASGLDMPLAGLESKIHEQQQKAAAETVQVQATGYDTIAIAQLDDPEGYVNIRDAASAEEGNVLGKLYDDSAATILGQEGDWYLIQSGSVTGYVKAEFFATGAQAEELAKEVGTQVAKVNTTTLMVRQEATTDSEVLALVGDSQNLQVVEDQGDWVKVAVDSDVVGYVSKDYVDCETQFVEAESKEEEAARIKAEEEAYLAALEEARRADEEAAAQAAAEAAAAEQEYALRQQQPRQKLRHKLRPRQTQKPRHKLRLRPRQQPRRRQMPRQQRKRQPQSRQRPKRRQPRHRPKQRHRPRRTQQLRQRRKARQRARKATMIPHPMTPLPRDRM